MAKIMDSRISVALSAAALSLLAACSGGSEPAPKSEETAATNTAAPETMAANTTETAAAPAEATVTYASLTGDAANGEKVFVQCKTCHVVEPGVNRIGPTLHGVVGRHSGSVPGFSYSAANKNSGLTWTEEELFVYLENPQKVVPGTKMAFGGLKKPQDRADVIAYLKTQS